MNERQGDPELRQVRRFVLWLLVALPFSAIMGVFSLMTGIASFNSHSGASGTVTTFTYHTLASRIVLSTGTLFHVGLMIGILCRARYAWRAAFALPALWTFMFATMNFPSLRHSGPGWSIAIPLACIAGIGALNTLFWRKQWAACEPFFQCP